MADVAIAAGIMSALGLVFAIVLATANHFLKVEEDPRLDEIEGMLPGSNCGACGTPGCRAFSEALLAGTKQPAHCTVSPPDTQEAVADVLGVDAGDVEQRVARLKCAGSQGLVGKLATYSGLSTCRGAVVVNGGGRACEWGCLGLGDCQTACTFDAIRMGQDAFSARGLPIVDLKTCTACGDCVAICPLDLFVIKPVGEKLFVQCSSPLEGEAARAACEVACDACGRCALDAPAGTVEIKGGLPVVSCDGELQPTAAATYRCPTGAIQWIEGQQFPRSTPALSLRGSE